MITNIIKYMCCNVYYNWIFRMCLYTNYTCMNKPLCDVTPRTPFIASVIQVASNSQTNKTNKSRHCVEIKYMYCSYAMITINVLSRCECTCMYILSEINKLSL